MYKKEKINIKKLIAELFGTVLGSFVMAFGIALFLLPNQLSSGGVTGIATILYYLLKIPMGITIITINAPLFLFSMFKIGKKFFIKSIVGTISLSAFMTII